MIAPFYTFVSAKAYKEGIMDEETNDEVSKKYKGLFDSLRFRSIFALNYHTLFFIRRYSVMTVIIFWHYYRLIHINTQLLTTYCFLCYIASFKPFKLSRSNL